jgi:hypothetical protein
VSLSHWEKRKAGKAELERAQLAATREFQGRRGAKREWPGTKAFFPPFFGKEREPLSFSLSFSRFNNIAIMRASSVAA